MPAVHGGYQPLHEEVVALFEPTARGSRLFIKLLPHITTYRDTYKSFNPHQPIRKDMKPEVATQGCPELLKSSSKSRV
ncbi:MAG: hypothetical protein QXV72_06865 [Sulfolobales archaeon]